MVDGIQSILANAPFVWHPASDARARTRLGRFLDRTGCQTVDELNERAAADPGWFWEQVVQDLGLVWQRPYEQVLDTSAGIAWARWFRGGRFNYVASTMMRWVAEGRGDQPALIWEGETGETRSISYRELDRLVRQCAEALQALGIGRGDCVGIYAPLCIESAAAILACGLIGAIFTPIFSGYASNAVATRLTDCGAKLLITADGFYRRGRFVPMKATADEAVAGTPSVEKVLVICHTGQAAPWSEGRDVWWHAIVDHQPGEIAPVETDPEDPMMVIYTSGTTGRPKGAVHSQCGFPIKTAQDMYHCFDVGPGDRIWWFTDIGWMMGPWLVIGALLLGATALLYDGTPDYPDGDRLWATIERHRVTHFGIAPTAIRSLMRLGEEPVRRHDLSSLRILGSTGEAWNPGPWQWYFDVVGGGKLPIINYSGGTEISGGIICGNPLIPIKPCSFAGPVPGMAADVVDDAGNPVRDQVGELVVRAPWVGMTRGFWRDPERYESTYWARWPGIWYHGDFAYIDRDGAWFILGRSDDTLNVAGKRVGPAEVESAVGLNEAVLESAAIGVPDETKGEAIVVLAVLRPEFVPSEELRQAISDAVVRELGKALRPKAVRFVDDLPKTRNAKILRRVARAVLLDQPTGDLSSLENPNAIEAIRQAR